jgi:hypothetical protein
MTITDTYTVSGNAGRVLPGVTTPPTLFARQAPQALVEAGHDLARRAIGKALERVPFDDAVRALIELADHSDDELRMAQDHLGYATFDVPLAAQVDALMLVEGARSRLAEQSAPRSIIHRIPRPRRHAA